MANVLVVEDNALLASSLVRFLRDAAKLDVAAVAPSAESALRMLPGMGVDLALVDIALPGMNGIALVALLRVQYPNLPCLMLSGHHESDYVRRALAAGAKGYVVKSDPIAIITAVQKVLTGELYLSEEMRRKLYH